MEITDFTSLSDQQLVELSAGQTGGAYDALVRRYENTLITMLQNRGACEPKDITQESFIKAYLNLDKYNPQYTFGQWITTIARNVHIDQTRRQKNSNQINEFNDNTPCAAPNPEQSIIRSQNQDLLRQQIKTLPLQYQNILHLRFWHEMSYEEIAAKLNIPMGTVKTHIHRARTMLLQYITKTL